MLKVTIKDRWIVIDIYNANIYLSAIKRRFSGRIFCHNSEQMISNTFII